jgi:hypothetical protein
MGGSGLSGMGGPGDLVRRESMSRPQRRHENMDFETYARSKFADYGALAETVAAILRAAIGAYPKTFRLQQVQQRPKNPESLRKKLEDGGILATTSLTIARKGLFRVFPCWTHQVQMTDAKCDR